jgi:hypothetical protein
MNSPTAIHLDTLSALSELFGLLNSGKHLNRLQDHPLWSELEREEPQYKALFAALGFNLQVDQRGFAWLHEKNTSSELNKTSRKLALFFMLIFQYQADTGKHLKGFTEWAIDRAMLTAIFDKNRSLLETSEISGSDFLDKWPNSACKYGFAVAEHRGWRLLPSVWRYLDLFKELAEDSMAKAEETESTLGAAS